MGFFSIFPLSMVLMRCAGYITDLCFPAPKLLLTAAEDSTISLFRTKDWAMLKVFKGHKVNHPRLCHPFDF
jgi:hypothetical protein